MVKISKDGSVIAVGAPKARTHTTNVGAVYLFEKVSVNWYMSKKLAGDDSLQNDYFGGAVDIADNNNRVIVAHLHDDFKLKGLVQFMSLIVQDLHGFKRLRLCRISK